MTDAERLAALFQDCYYSDPQGGGAAIKTRFDSGDLKIDFAPKNWRDDWWTDPYFRVSVPIVLELVRALPGVKEFKLYYTPATDFHYVRFEYEGDEYAVQWYKVFCLYRKSDKKSCNFGFDRYGIAPFFRRGDHKNTERFWYEGGTIANPFVEEQES